MSLSGWNWHRFRLSGGTSDNRRDRWQIAPAVRRRLQRSEGSRIRSKGPPTVQFSKTERFLRMATERSRNPRSASHKTTQLRSLDFLQSGNYLNRATSTSDDPNSLFFEVISVVSSVSGYSAAGVGPAYPSFQAAECMTFPVNVENPSIWGQAMSLSVPRALTTTSASSTKLSLVAMFSTVTCLLTDKQQYYCGSNGLLTTSIDRHPTHIL
jgi:hypothetical protein